MTSPTPEIGAQILCPWQLGEKQLGQLIGVCSSEKNSVQECCKGNVARGMLHGECCKDLASWRHDTSGWTIISKFESAMMGKDKPETKMKIRFCRSCHRPEYHKPTLIPVSRALLISLAVLTLGLILLISLKRCVCCGQLRVT